MSRKITRLAPLSLSLVALACSSEPAPEAKVEDHGAALVPLGSCGEVEGALREAALAEMNRTIDAEFQNFLDYGVGDCGDAYAAADGSGGAGGGAASSGPGGGAEKASGTNNQVVGVDEADFVKNDNEYLYVASGGALRIIDAWPAAEAHEIASVKLEGVPKKLFVEAGRAVVYSSMKTSVDPYDPYAGYGGGECTYGYDCDFVGDGAPTRVSVFDLTDKTQPRLVREFELSGSLIAARRVGTSIHTVVHDAGPSFPGVSYFPEGIGFCSGHTAIEAFVAYEMLRAKNADIIKRAPITDFVPSVVERPVGEHPGGTNLLAGCDGFYRSPRLDGNGFISVVSFDVTNDEAYDASTIVSRPGAVYASADALYVAVRQYADGGGWYFGMHDSKSVTTLHKFALGSSPASSTYAASGLVKGSVLNQFAMDEWQGNLRVATSSGHVPDPSVHSTLTVLAEENGALVERGRVDGIAPGEDIRSVRFAEDRGFVVTFKKTDPLFTFDLKDPTAPRLLAELKIPGFSTYMHMLDATHLLTIGYDADDQGSFAWFQGVLLQIFDVSDPQHPLLSHKEAIGTRGSSSEALTNHLAFNYYAPLDLLALPMTVCEDSAGGGSYGMDMTFSGLMVYDVTAKSGFSLRGKVAHPSDATTGGYDSMGCSNWWTQASSKVKRSVILDNFVFSISEDLIKVNDLNALSKDLAVIPIGG